MMMTFSFRTKKFIIFRTVLIVTGSVANTVADFEVGKESLEVAVWELRL